MNSKMNKYEYRQRVFEAAELCLKLKNDSTKNRKTGKSCEIAQTDLTHACAILKSGSILLRELVLLGFLSFAEGNAQVRQACRSRSRQRYFSEEESKRFEERIRREYEQQISADYVSHIFTFLAWQAVENQEMEYSKDFLRFLRMITLVMENVYAERFDRMDDADVC